MRRLILGSLGLLLGCLVAQAPAEEVQWRPAGSRFAPSSAATGEPTAPERGIGLNRPVPIQTGLAPRLDSAVQPVAFSPTESSPLRPIFRAKPNDPPRPMQHDVLKPLPQGPTIPAPASGGTPGQSEPAPPPAPLTGSKTPPPVPGTPRLDVPPGAVWGSMVPHGEVAVVSPSGFSCDPCGSCCCLPCDPCCDCFSPCWGGEGGLPRCWARAEYLAWSIRDPAIPIMVTRDNRLRSPTVANNGLKDFILYLGLGNPNTQVAFGGGDLDLGTFSGGRFTIGLGGPHGELGFEATMFFLGERTNRFFIASDPTTGFPGIGIPFESVGAAATGPRAVFVARPSATTDGGLGLQAGSVTIDYVSRLWGIEGNVRKPCHNDGIHKLDCLVGFRYINLEERLVQTETTTLLQTPGAPSPFVAGDSLRIIDSFGVINNLYLGQVGLDYECRHGRWIFGVMGKLGIGSVHQVVNLGGVSTFTGPGVAPTAIAGGGLRVFDSTNAGHHTRDQFVFVPELGLKLGYQLTDNLNVFVGYNLLYLSSVVRAGDQVDTTIAAERFPPTNIFAGGRPPNQTPAANTGPARPAVLFRATDFWAQGVNAGLEWKY